MPEIPEIASRAREMNEALPGKTISRIEILQPKCLNLPPEDFSTSLTGALIREISYHGKWLKINTTKGWLLLNLGMGGEILLTTREQMPQKYRLVFDFDDRSCLVINFWWFGYAFFSPADGLDQVRMIAKLGPNALDLTEAEFIAIIKAQRPGTKVKAFLLDQSRLAGIGNAYIHDILFLCGLHPMRTLGSLSDDDISSLFKAVHEGLEPSLSKNGAFYETDLFGQKGGFTMADILVGYREGSPCPKCGTAIEKIRTGSTSSFICPKCQLLN